MDLQDIAVVHTCGICETIIDQNDIPMHDCIRAYKKFFVDNNYYFYPVTGDNRIVRRSLVNNKEVVLPVREKISGTITTLSSNELQAEKENRSHNERDKIAKSTLNYDDEELLILLVQERRPLWDFTIPLEQRCQRITKKLWDEVSETLRGKLSGEEAKKNLKIYMTPIDE
ncbi:uncharacterized protein LOC120359192 [Solenopsis invicta]|nr:uncharacterized protein LOC120357560 [Solenopsis invicta]XP_039306470.1 uncharacterized protein LOC120358047 [Solenopsis invicta]XP_039308550.1 uncharacterized protein LOC105202839 [Solenopsis invicta]XP_039311784.1 uncharacterized protein LOC105202274 [Solenopsis invicta]XP_039311786.1 uncharacterized protein LOC105202274 [Solenopsis invicta]XP_039311791.1 uncharacterized protein LOC105202274 [Solenopsis invicta]XP_039311793.1 uncharacterized protein LOC105202274 [Solenopsis invicta]XP_0